MFQASFGQVGAALLCISFDVLGFKRMRSCTTSLSAPAAAWQYEVSSRMGCGKLHFSDPAIAFTPQHMQFSICKADIPGYIAQEVTLSCEPCHGACMLMLQSGAGKFQTAFYCSMEAILLHPSVEAARCTSPKTNAMTTCLLSEC